MNALCPLLDRWFSLLFSKTTGPIASACEGVWCSGRRGSQMDVALARGVVELAPETGRLWNLAIEWSPFSPPALPRRCWPFNCAGARRSGVGRAVCGVQDLWLQFLNPPSPDPQLPCLKHDGLDIFTQRGRPKHVPRLRMENYLGLSL